MDGLGALPDEHSLPGIRIHVKVPGRRLGLDAKRSSRPMERVSFSRLQHAHPHGRVGSRLIAPCSYHRNLQSSPTIHDLMQAMNEAPLAPLVLTPLYRA